MWTYFSAHFVVAQLLPYQIACKDDASSPGTVKFGEHKRTARSSACALSLPEGKLGARRIPCCQVTLVPFALTLHQNANRGLNTQDFIFRHTQRLFLPRMVERVLGV